jgi:DeoR family fructose operon transcriptional repressor
MIEMLTNNHYYHIISLESVIVGGFMISKRQQQIIDILNKDQSVSVHKLCKLLFASESTIRRDLTSMEQQGVINRYYGGAIIANNTQVESSLLVRGQTQRKEKQSIVNECSRLLQSNANYFIDSSSTLSYLISYLGNLKNISIITNGLSNSLYLSNNQQNNIFVTGGKLNFTTNSLLGTETINFISSCYCDYFIFSCSGITTNGVFEINDEQSQVKRAMLKHAKVHILLVDSSKFDKQCLIKTCKFDEIDYVITVKLPSQEYIDCFNESNTKLLISK